MWTLKLRIKKGDYSLMDLRRITNTVFLNDITLPKRKELMELMGFIEGNDTHHFLYKDNPNINIYIHWEEYRHGITSTLLKHYEDSDNEYPKEFSKVLKKIGIGIREHSEERAEDLGISIKKLLSNIYPELKEESV